MNENNYVLLSLGDEKSKHISQSISNKSARKILAYLSNRKDASETEISEKLKIKLTTVHYNLQNLKKSGLIERKHFKWSPKGNKIYFYSLANKFIVIAPKKSSFQEALKKILPVALVATTAGIILRAYNSNFVQSFSKLDLVSSKNIEKITPISTGTFETTRIVSEASTAGGFAPMALGVPEVETITNVTTTFNKTVETLDISQVNNYVLIPDYAMFFLMGAWFVIILMILYSVIKKK